MSWIKQNIIQVMYSFIDYFEVIPYDCGIREIQ